MLFKLKRRTETDPLDDWDHQESREDFEISINSVLNIEKDKVEKNDRVYPWKKGIYKEGQNGHCSIEKPIYILRTQWLNIKLDKNED